MNLLKERLIRELDALSPGELFTVQQLIERLKQPPSPATSAPATSAPSAASPSSAQRVRAALAHLPGSLSDAIRQEREERI